MKKLLHAAIVTLLSIVSCSQAQWAPVANGANAPVSGAQMSQLSIGSRQNIWSLWQLPFEQNSIVSHWTGKQWISTPGLSEVGQIAGITAPNEANTVLLLSGHDDNALQALIENQPGADETEKAQKTVVGIQNGTLSVPQQLSIWNGSQLIPVEINNTVATSVDAFNRSNIALTSVSPSLHRSLNALSPDNSKLSYLATPESTLEVQAGSNGFYFLVQDPAQPNNLQIRSSDAIYYTLENVSPEALLYWNVSNNSVWVVLDQGGVISITKIDKTSKKEAILPDVPGLISHNNAGKILFSTGFDDAAWALSNDGTMYQYQ